MKMLMKDGTIMEGTPVSDRDIEIMEAIKDTIRDIPYISVYGSDREKIARHLILNFDIAKRNVPLEFAENSDRFPKAMPEEMPMPTPVSPVPVMDTEDELPI